MNLELGWQRLKQDRPQRCFTQHPYAIGWIDLHQDEWLASIETRLSDQYSPSSAALCQVPKSGPLVRPGAVLDLADETVFNALVGEFHPRIYEQIRTAQGDPDIAYQLKAPSGQAEWIKAGVKIWKEWRERSLAKLKDGVQFVAVADVVAFYENIDLDKLASDLRGCGVDQQHLRLLMNLLRKWAAPRGKGIPQGISAADILAKLYMSEVDQGLRNNGFTHLRYVDDIRIFCKTRLEARKALLKLNELVRNRGLNLQSAKTKIVRIDEAGQMIDGVTPIIEIVHAEWIERIQALNESFLQDLSASELAGALDESDDLDTDNPPVEVLEEAFRNYFEIPWETFKSSLFHYLLRRLGRASSRVAVQYCIEQLSQRPEESGYCLRYLATVNALEATADQILRFAGSQDAIYDYQLYQIARTYFEAEVFPEELLRLARLWAGDRNRKRWLRTYSIAILGAAGDTSDLTALEASYGSAATELEKAGIARALARMELSRRNRFYSSIQNDGNLVAWAIADAKEVA